MSAATALTSFFHRQVDERLLLKRAEQTAKSRTPTQQQLIRSLFDAATVRIEAAAELSDPLRIPAAGTLYREAAVLLIRALHAAREDDASDLEATAAHAWLAERVEAGEMSAPATALSAQKELLLGSDLLVLDRMSTEEAHAAYSSLQEFVSWLQRQLEPRTAAEIRKARWVRLGFIAVIVGALLLTALLSLFKETNLAEGKPASASSQHPGTPMAGGVTNGTIESTFGVHTTVEAEPWIQIDLLVPTLLDRVKVYSRRDGWQNEIVPLVLETSLDGAHFAVVAERAQPFVDKPWVWSGGGATARYLRVRKPTHGYIALAEIEVYGDKAR